MEQTTSRLRKTFRYPTDHDSEDEFPEAIDEEEQESLIRTLQTHNLATNTQFARLLLVLPLLSTLPYLTTLTAPHTTLLSILSITSLLCTAYLLYTLPPGVTGLRLLDNLQKPKGTTTPQLKLQGSAIDSDGPIRTYVPPLNLALCIVLIGLGSIAGRKHDVWWGFGWTPAFVQAIVLLAKFIMGGVDPEGELGRLRYEFKGA